MSGQMKERSRSRERSRERPRRKERSKERFREQSREQSQERLQPMTTTVGHPRKEKPSKIRKWIKRIGKALVFLLIFGLVLGVMSVVWIYWNPRKRKEFQDSSLRILPQSKVDLKGLQSVSVDLEKYQGLWFEHIRMDSWFERGLQDVTARYVYDRESKQVSLLNSGVDRLTKRVTSAEGIARINSEPGVLLVSFGPKVFEAPYVVLFVDADYTMAIVGSPSREHAWLLTRTSTPITESQYKFFVETLARNRYSKSQIAACVSVYHTSEAPMMLLNFSSSLPPVVSVPAAAAF